jgi:hypothetical protein
MATTTAVITKTVTIFSHDPEGTFRRMARMSRRGMRDVTIVESHARQGGQVVIARVKAGSEAEALALQLQRRGETLTRVGEAIREGRAYLDTAWGRRKVVSYNDRAGDAVTLNPGEDRFFSQRTFMVSVEMIRIEPATAIEPAVAVVA